MLNKESLIYIAGHTGLVGSACVKYFSEKGFTNLQTASRKNLDLRKSYDVSTFIEKIQPEYIVLAAGKVGGIQMNISSPATLMLTNLQIQNNIMCAARKTRVRKVILFGSSCMYPKNCEQPMREEKIFSGEIEQTSSAYATSKIAGLQLSEAMNKEDKEDRFTCLIPNSVYGPNDNFDPETGHVLSALIARFVLAKQEATETVTLWGSGRARREFVHSQDVASACLHAMSLERNIGAGPFNVGCGADISIRELALKIAEIVGYQGKILWDTTKPEGVLKKLLDSSKFTNMGWIPQKTFDDGLAETVNWFKEKRMV